MSKAPWWLVSAVCAFAACSVDRVTFQSGEVPGGPREDCSLVGDEDGDGAADCEDTACAALPQCAPTCRDDKKNGDETDVDCGGSCGACGIGENCADTKDCGAGTCDAGRCRAAISCNEILIRHPGSPDGVYSIAPSGVAVPFRVVCDMSRDGGGWTLLLKADGSSTLSLNVPAWTDDSTLNADDVTVLPGNAKYQSFNTAPVGILRGELDGYRFTKAFAGLTARQIFSGAPSQVTPYQFFNTGAPNWSTQPNCQTYGTNITHENTDLPNEPPFFRVRFGWTANQENQCLSNDTLIGFGTNGRGAGYRCGSTLCDQGNVDAGANGLLWGR